MLSHLAQSGVHHGRWGCFSKCSLCAFIIPRLGATLISEFSWSRRSKCMVLHWLREKLERLLLPQKYQVTCSLILIVYRNHHIYFSRAPLKCKLAEQSSSVGLKQKQKTKVFLQPLTFKLTRTCPVGFCVSPGYYFVPHESLQPQTSADWGLD